MKLLLDTHALLWWVSDDERLTARVRRRMADPRNEVLFSVVSAWEILIKVGLGKLRLSEPPSKYLPRHLEASGFSTLPIHLRHVLAVEALPDLHRDPFDRLLIGQAIAERAALVTGDAALGAYPVKVVW